MSEKSDVQEIQLWMPYGDQGQDNLPSLQEYIDIAIRRDGALPGAIADCKTYNKVLYQLTRLAVGFALFINEQGLPVKDSYSVEELRDTIVKAVRVAVNEVLVPSEPNPDNPGYKPDITHEVFETTLTQQAVIDAPIQVLTYDVGKPSVMVFFDGVFMNKGTGEEPEGTPVWYEVGNPQTTSNIIKFRCIIPQGATLQVVRYGELKY